MSFFKYRRVLTRTALLALAVVAAAGCATRVTVPVSLRSGRLPDTMRRFATAGAEMVGVERGRLESEWGCVVEYELFSPAGTGVESLAARSTPLVVVAHGFMRELAAMRGWADMFASRGYRTVAVSFCNSTWLNGHHARNAADLLAVARALTTEGTPVLYAGFSAGGLSALIAASRDPSAVGYLGLDPVDSGGLASDIGNVAVPALFLFGAPSSCNAEGNMIEVMPAASPRIALRIPFATHCDFENPYDPACAGICGSVEPQSEEEAIRNTIRALATAWVSARVGNDAEGDAIFAALNLAQLVGARRVEIISGD